MTLVCARNLCEGCLCLDEQALGLAPPPQQVRQFLVLALDESLQAQGEKRAKSCCARASAMYSTLRNTDRHTWLTCSCCSLAWRRDLIWSFLREAPRLLRRCAAHHN